jgi:hypothetical protein
MRVLLLLPGIESRTVGSAIHGLTYETASAVIPLKSTLISSHYPRFERCPYQTMKEFYLSATSAKLPAHCNLPALDALKGKYTQDLGKGADFMVQDQLFNWSINWLYSLKAKFIRVQESQSQDHTRNQLGTIHTETQLS